MKSRSPAGLLLALALLVAACDSAQPTETTAPEETTTTTSLPPAVGRVALDPNGPPITSPGDRGALVEALQFYLVCVGLESPDPEGPAVTVDGAYGPITAFAVAYYQAQIRRAPSGSPDDETFAMLARECESARELRFPTGENEVEIAGNAAPGDEEVFTYDGQAGQVLGLTAAEGSVGIAVADAAGNPVTEAGVSVQADLAGTERYSITVSASEPTTYRITAQLRSPNVLVSDFGPMVLRGDGVGVSGAEFGSDAENARAVLTLLLGGAAEDTDWQDDVGGCPGTHRVITWLIQAVPGSGDHPAVFVAYFTEVNGEPTFVEYRYHSLDLASLDPLAQGLATAEGISIGSTLAQFTDAYGAPTIGSQGRVSIDAGLDAVFDIVGDPDPDLSRVRVVDAGTGGCAELG